MGVKSKKVMTYCNRLVNKSGDLCLKSCLFKNLMHSALKQYLRRSTLHRRVRKRPEGRRSSSKIGSKVPHWRSLDPTLDIASSLSGPNYRLTGRYRKHVTATHKSTCTCAINAATATTIIMIFVTKSYQWWIQNYRKTFLAQWQHINISKNFIHAGTWCVLTLPPIKYHTPQICWVVGLWRTRPTCFPLVINNYK